MKQELKQGDCVGRWLLLEEQTDADGKRKWLCRCSCGTERLVAEKSLRYGESKSCGCLRKEWAEREQACDLTGRQFGELTVLGKAPPKPNSRGTVWRCRCSCGEEYLAKGTLLTTGRRTRCPGKAHQKGYSYVDITGRRFGMLEALYVSRRYDKSGSMIWRCRCDCGQEKDISYNALVYGGQQSCGCKRKAHEQRLHTFLTHVDGTSVDMLKSRKLPVNNTTGCKGVYLIRGRYMAKIVFRKKAYNLGWFNDYQQAVKARKAAEETLFCGVAEHYERWKARAETDPAWAEENPVQVFVEQRADKSIDVRLLPNLQTMPAENKEGA